jgi:hypothetical protein
MIKMMPEIERKEQGLEINCPLSGWKPTWNVRENYAHN